jgi:signal transduction histidine kinase
LTTLLLLLGTALAAALAFQLWRSLELEARSRAVELEKAEIAAERILKQAQGSRAVFELLPAAQRFLLLADGVEVGDDVGWLDETPAHDDADLVVQDRLDRAARAEFAAKDAAAAVKEYDELLAGPLLPAHRLQALAAACWQAQRAGDAARLLKLRDDLEARLAALPARDCGHEIVANAVASAARLRQRCDGGRPEWLRRLVPLLPPAIAATCIGEFAERGPDELGALLQRATQRRELLRNADWSGAFVGPSREERQQPGMRTYTGSGPVFWWLPRNDGKWDGAVVDTADWLAAVQRACTAGQLPEWPWLLAASTHWGTLEDAMQAGANLDPWFVDLVPIEPPMLTKATQWLPLATAVLVAVFGLAMASQFRASRREADAVRAQADFLTTVTHELKTPLASIRLLADMLAERRAAGREVEYYGMLASETARLSMLIENVLDLGRIERGERIYDLRSLDFAAVVAETAALFAPQAERAGIDLQVQARDGALPVRADRSGLVQALLNVLDNARKYGGGDRLELRLWRDGGNAHFAVRDFGPGVPADERERIFERFVRGREQAHGSVPGVGIGLYLARAIVQRLGGDLRCGAPAGGPGAEFTFTLPLETA